MPGDPVLIALLIIVTLASMGVLYLASLLLTLLLKLSGQGFKRAFQYGFGVPFGLWVLWAAVNLPTFEEQMGSALTPFISPASANGDESLINPWAL